MSIYSITDINGLIINRKIVHLSIQFGFFHVFNCKTFWTVSQVQWRWLYFKVVWFELMDFYIISIQSVVGCMVKQTRTNFITRSPRSRSSLFPPIISMSWRNLVPSKNKNIFTNSPMGNGNYKNTSNLISLSLYPYLLGSANFTALKRKSLSVKSMFKSLDKLSSFKFYCYFWIENPFQLWSKAITWCCRRLNALFGFSYYDCFSINIWHCESIRNWLEY